MGIHQSSFGNWTSHYHLLWNESTRLTCHTSWQDIWQVRLRHEQESKALSLPHPSQSDWFSICLLNIFCCLLQRHSNTHLSSYLSMLKTCTKKRLQWSFSAIDARILLHLSHRGFLRSTYRRALSHRQLLRVLLSFFCCWFWPVHLRQWFQPHPLLYRRESCKAHSRLQRISNLFQRGLKYTIDR